MDVQLAGPPLTSDALGKHPVGGLVTQTHDSGKVGVVGETEAEGTHLAIFAQASALEVLTADRPSSDSGYGPRALGPRQNAR